MRGLLSTTPGKGELEEAERVFGKLGKLSRYVSVNEDVSWTVTGFKKGWTDWKKTYRRHFSWIP